MPSSLSKSTNINLNQLVIIQISPQSVCGFRESVFDTEISSGLWPANNYKTNLFTELSEANEKVKPTASQLKVGNLS